MRSMEEMWTVAVVVVRDEGGRVLLRRSGAAAWALPGGTIADRPLPARFGAGG